jgi:hypothetical protein
MTGTTVIPAEPGWYEQHAIRSTSGHGVMAGARRVVAWSVLGMVVTPVTLGRSWSPNNTEVEFHPTWTSGEITVREHGDDREYGAQERELMVWAEVVLSEEKAS